MEKLKRIELIQKINEEIKSKSVDEINFLFKECDVPYTKFNQGYGHDSDFDFNTTRYILEKLSEAGDTAILSLGAHLFRSEFSLPIESSWEKNMFKLFLSHSSLDKIFLSDLKNNLHRCEVARSSDQRFPLYFA